jgi:spermidine synthase
MCGNALAPGGVLNVQSTSPYYATKSFWCVTKTLESEGFVVSPYHLQVPAFGDWGFNMAVKADNDMVVSDGGSFASEGNASVSSGKRIAYEKIKINSGIETKYLSEDNIQALFRFGKDEIPGPEDNIEVNQLTKPVMIKYYNEAVRNWE